jgi:RND family efflux transporter MFP subunit
MTTNNSLKITLPIVILVLGVAAAVILASSRRAPEPEERVVLGPLVEVITAQPTQVDTVVRGTGQVEARVTVELVPQVSGSIVNIHPGLITGGHFRAGEALLTIDPRDFELAVERAKAAVARAEVTLEREQAEAEVARNEWDAIHPGEAPDSGLVVREPQVRQSEAELAAAQADLAVAELKLDRTRISLPFDGIVQSEAVDLGQYVTVGKRLATVFATDAAEVRVPLAERELAWFNVPTRPGMNGPAAQVMTHFGGHEQHWSGKVVRMEAQVDPSSRMVTIVIAIPRPFEINEKHQFPLLPGTFVDVEISGHNLPEVVALPRHAIHEGGVVWVVAGKHLSLVPVTIVRTDRDTAFVSEGIEPGVQVVVSQLDAVTDGMEVRAIESKTAVGSGT